MIKNYIKTAFRNLIKHKAFSLINISGLAIGMACCLLIIIFVQDELSYDKFHAKADRIYRMTSEENQRGIIANYPLVFSGVPSVLQNDYSEVLNFVRFDPRLNVLIGSGDKQFYEERLFYADASVFEVFTFPLIKGDPRTALKEPYSIVLTEKMAEKYFSGEDPIGQTLTIDNEHDYKIKGILKRIPRNSHIKFDFLASVATLEAQDPRYGKLWAWNCYAYLLLPGDYSYLGLERKFPDFIRRHRGEKAAQSYAFSLQPLTSIHLHSHLAYEIEASGDIRYVYIFSAIAFFILLIACINFMNLSTARSVNRAKEVGVRKVLGADRIRLTKQFLGESLFLSLVALPIAVALVELFLPAFNVLTGKDLRIDYFGNSVVLIGLTGILLFVGIISGSYPAFFLSTFRPSEVLKGKLKAGSGSSLFRKVLVVVQFSISIVLIAGTIIIYNQLDFIRNKKLGFDKDHVVVMPVSRSGIGQNFEAFKRELLQNPGVESVCGSTSLPSLLPTRSVFIPEGVEEGERLTLRNVLVDYDFIKTFGLEIKEGREFSRDFATDMKEAFVVNEAAAKEFGWDSAVGKRLIDLEGPKGHIVGVVKDFHFRSKHQRIEPLILSLLPSSRYVYFVSVKIKSSNISDTLAFLKSRWNAFSPGWPFEYFFLDDNFDRMYKSEDRLRQVFLTFTFLAIFIACLGLFGLAAFTAEQRTKEIGIRKVLGASVPGVVLLLSKEFIKWVLIANVIAWPVAYFALSRWLENFA
ncbi:MAG: ABC transporter permease, partial [Candidatus Aminicenantes bacterium]|nr:ABC transporter permease [Candidatus Aminicenantes bacterium]